MNTLVTLELKGNGRQRLEELVAEAVQNLKHDPAIQAAFRSHPNLYSEHPEGILGKVSRGRATRLIESGFLSEDELVGDAIFGRGRVIDTSLPLAVLMSALDLLPPSANHSLPTPEILFQNEDFLALNKPADMPSAPLHSDEADSVVHRALAHCPGLPVLRGNPLEPGLVHRLDTGTSGVLLFAKTVAAFERVQKIWNTGAVKKEYRAITATSAGLRIGRSELLLGHDAKSKRRMRAITDPKDKKMIRGEPSKSVSEIKSIRELPNSRGFEIQLQIETGIHHQIRVTLAHHGAPILGDAVYGGTPEERLWLHAYKLILPDGSGKFLEIVAPLPATWLTG